MLTWYSKCVGKSEGGFRALSNPVSMVRSKGVITGPFPVSDHAVDDGSCPKENYSRARDEAIQLAIPASPSLAVIEKERRRAPTRRKRRSRLLRSSVSSSLDVGSRIFGPLRQLGRPIPDEATESR